MYMQQAVLNYVLYYLKNFFKKTTADTEMTAAAKTNIHINAALPPPCTIISMLAVRPVLSVTVTRDLPQTPACTIPERSTDATKIFEE